MKTTLLIMAAGIGSRFGGGIKQLEPVGLNDEIIMDYSVHDAIAAGFNKLIFVIRKDIEADFRSRIGDRIEALCSRLDVEVHYAFQDMQDIPAGFQVPADRKKPWGTGQAVLQPGSCSPSRSSSSTPMTTTAKRRTASSMAGFSSPMQKMPSPWLASCWAIPCPKAAA